MNKITTLCTLFIIILLIISIYKIIERRTPQKSYDSVSFNEITEPPATPPKEKLYNVTKKEWTSEEK